jgi:hypothetical protein
MKRVALLLLPLMLMGAGCSLMSQDSVDSTNRVAAPGTEEDVAVESRTTSGAVTEVSLDGMAADGPGIIKIRTAAGAEDVINVPSFGLALCAAKDNIADVYSIEVGDEVEVRGAVIEEGVIVPCTSADHYLRVK